MFGGLTKTSSRLAIAVALGFAFGGIAMGSKAEAADLGGDCCADLEERVAELEATTVRKGNKKVSVTLSGWVIKSVNWWDDGDLDHFIVGDKDYDLGSRFAITGSAQIAPGWSAGFNMTVLAPSTVFGFGANQLDDTAGTYGSISTLYSYLFIKSDNWGTLNWGHLSPASDNPAVLADISGTVIESNAVFFEGNGFLLRPDGSGLGGAAGLSGLAWGNFVTCLGLGAGIGADCWGAAQPAVRYDTPTWGGFSVKTSYGANRLTGPFGQADDSDFADVALFYAKDWGPWKVSAAAAYTWIETAAATERNGVNDTVANEDESDLFQVGGTIMHSPSGLGIYGLYQHESTDSRVTDIGGLNAGITFNIPDSDVWYLKPFWKAKLSPLGATVFFGEYGEYQDQYGGIAGVDVTSFFDPIDPPACVGLSECYVTGSEVQRWGLGVVQEIDAAAMHLFARWQHQELDVDFIGFDGPGNRVGVNQGFDDWDVFQAGGIIFF